MAIAVPKMLRDMAAKYRLLSTSPFSSPSPMLFSSEVEFEFESENSGDGTFGIRRLKMVLTGMIFE